MINIDLYYFYDDSIIMYSIFMIIYMEDVKQLYTEQVHIYQYYFKEKNLSQKVLLPLSRKLYQLF